MKQTIQSTLAFLPPAVAEYQFALAMGRKWAFDWAWPVMSVLKPSVSVGGVAWEIEGGTRQQGRHNRHVGYRSDCEKYSEAAILGYCVIRTTSDMVASGKALDLLERALKARGMA